LNWQRFLIKNLKLLAYIMNNAYLRTQKPIKSNYYGNKSE